MLPESIKAEVGDDTEANDVMCNAMDIKVENPRGFLQDAVSSKDSGGDNYDNGDCRPLAEL